MSTESGSRVFWLLIVALLLSLMFPISVAGQGRGHGKGRGPDLDKKCGKFVNCHDARDGRWDGRGPGRNLVLLRNRTFIHRHGRNRVREFDNEDSFRLRRLRFRNRDFDDTDLFRRRGLRNRIDDEFVRRGRFHRR